jgi:hypothetical protein
MTLWLPLEPVNPGQGPQGSVLLDITFKAFEDDEQVRFLYELRVAVILQAS